MAPLSIQSGVNYAKTLLPETLKRAARVFMLSCCSLLTLVLEEDGTVVDSEEFFQSLPSRTPLMVLDQGEMWSHTKILPSFREPKKKGVARVTFDLYKVHPKDFLCCLTVRATLYEVYTLSYDFRCTRVKQVLRSVLRCVTCLTRITGQLLLCTSSSLLHLTADDHDDGS